MKVFQVITLWLIFCQPSFAEKLFLFDIQKQPADQALISFAKQTNKTIVFSYELTKNYQTNTLQGYYSFNQALRKLLRNTGLIANLENNQLSITANRSLLAASSTNNTDLSSAPTNSPSSKIKGNHQFHHQIEKIAIVGSRDIARSIQELPVPVDILSHQSLQSTGEFEVGKMLQSIAPSFNFASSSISDGTDVLKPATLRGLGPDQTLILVNGKRRHYASLLHINTSVGRGTAGADLNTIPLSAIKRIEILRDGATAQYGSDAIAGVINIILKDSANSGNFHSTIGQYQQGDGNTLDISLNKGVNIQDKGFINTTINLLKHQATDRSGLHGSCQYQDCLKLENGDYLTQNPKEITANRKTFSIGDPAYQQLSLAYNANYSLTSGELYSFAIYSKRSNHSYAFFRHNGNKLANPVLQDDVAVRPEGYLPYIQSDIKDVSFNLGFKTEIDNHTTFDISFTQGKNTIDYQTKDSLNASYANLLNIQGILTPDQIRSQIPQSAKAYDLSLSLQTFNIDLQRIYEYFSLSLGVEIRNDKYQVTPGEKYSYYDYDGQESNPYFDINALGGIQGFPGISAMSSVNESRQVNSLYVELNSELNESITIDGALRYDNYNDFGGTTNIKFAANWRMNDSVTFRSSISTGFRAPSMQQLYFNNISTQFIIDDNEHFSAEQIGTFRNDSYLASLIGIPKLTEEQSTNFTLGSVFTFTDKFSVTLDYYAIDIDDRIVISNKLGSGLSPALSEILQQNHVDKAQVFLNGVNTKTRGLDLIATWKTPIFNGYFDVTFAGNITDTAVSERYAPNSTVLNALSIEQVFSEQDISIIEEWQPQNRLSVNSTYLKNNWSWHVNINRYGEYTITDGGKQTYGAEILTDIRVEHQFNRQVSWYVGVNNLFNVTPDKNTIANSHAGTIIDNQGNEIVSSSGVFKYSRRSAPFGFNGSYLYLGLNYHFE
ncbi:TonB-dependent receptor [Colwellia sp. 1_MG-2023]|uniref:TonB-dependent receptor domain-containing protein n=1 Tax=Colwellia sp. 1_MG-2023 TaxID=3062649 RepID=UPI0026E2C096|nr:TonB-dependent receptor [Colwellia sp. 1_MG-2023]MDO6445589.1 TonB-dependent receptor [Colwellia sp. 1_MG-2023]